MKASKDLLAICKDVSVLEQNEHCIYFLLNNEDVVYIGKCEAGISRVKQHYFNMKFGGEKEFTSFAIVPFPFSTKESLAKIESKYIAKYLPKYNKSFGLKIDGEYTSLTAWRQAKGIKAISLFDLDKAGLEYIKLGIVRKYKVSDLERFLSESKLL